MKAALSILHYAVLLVVEYGVANHAAWLLPTFKSCSRISSVAVFFLLGCYSSFDGSCSSFFALCFIEILINRLIDLLIDNSTRVS